jgi:hypothetical protein
LTLERRGHYVGSVGGSGLARRSSACSSRSITSSLRINSSRAWRAACQSGLLTALTSSACASPALQGSSVWGLPSSLLDWLILGRCQVVAEDLDDLDRAERGLQPEEGRQLVIVGRRPFTRGDAPRVGRDRRTQKGDAVSALGLIVVGLMAFVAMAALAVAIRTTTNLAMVVLLAFWQPGEGGAAPAPALVTRVGLLRTVAACEAPRRQARRGRGGW